MQETFDKVTAFQIPPEHSERQHDVITVDSNDEESLQQSEDSCMLQNEGN